MGHYQQARRGEELRPLRAIGQPNAVIIDGPTAWILLTGNDGREVARAAIDIDDLALVASHRWRVIFNRKRRGGPYAAAHGAPLMHRLILSAPAGVEVDHIDRDGLNNRRANLRLASRSENAQNVRRESRELPRNVYHNGSGFCASVALGGRNHSGGTFRTVEEAEAAATALRLKLLRFAVD